MDPATARKEAFEAAKRRREEEKKKDADRKAGIGGNSNYAQRDPVDYTALEKGGFGVFRILSAPVGTEGFPSAKEVLYSEIQYLETPPKTLAEFTTKKGNQKRKKLKLFWEPKGDDREQDHLLWRFTSEILKYKWDKELKEGKGDRVYENATGPGAPIYLEVALNGLTDQKYPSGWLPGKNILMNVIDRSRLDWHASTGRAFVLSKSMNVWEKSAEEKIEFFHPGVPPTVYNMLVDQIVEYYGDWSERDIIIERKDGDPWYAVYNSENYMNDKAFMAKNQLNGILKPEFALRPLTTEELALKHCDFDEYFRPTSYLKIFNRLGYVFRFADQIFSTTYYEELKEKAAEDKARMEAENKEKEKTSSQTAVPAKVASATSQESASDSDLPFNEDPSEEGGEAAAPEEVTEVRAPRGTKSAEETTTPTMPSWESLLEGTFNGTKYLGVPKLTEEEKSLIKGVNADGSFIYAEMHNGKKVKVVPSTTTGFKSPTLFHVCPLEGLEFD